VFQIAAEGHSTRSSGKSHLVMLLQGSFMFHHRFRARIAARRSKRTLFLEPLENRQLLSTQSTTMSMNAKASRMIGQVATGRLMVIEGRTTPNASLRIHVGNTTKVGLSNSSGHYQFKLSVPSGSYLVKIKAHDHTGHVSTSSMAVTHGDAVVAWVDTMIQVIKADIANVGLASRTMAMVSAAVYDAVNDIQRTGSVYKIDVHATPGASAPAAASAAAYTLLSALDPQMQPLLDARMAQSLAAVPSGAARAAGVQVGREVAQGILAWRANDGSSAIVPYVPGTAPGDWRPTPPTYQDAWGPEWGRVNTFAITKPASAFVAPPPPAMNSPEYAAAFNQVESLGALNSTTRTADQTQIGQFWSYDTPAFGTPVVRYEQIAETIALQQHNSLTQNARMFGLVNLAMADAGIAAWNTKYIYNRWRPVTAIQLADTEGNPATTADPTWTPLGSPNDPDQPSFTPPFPSYVSGHATFGSALFTTLAKFYGANRIHFTLTSDILPGVPRSYTSFSQASYENAISRIYLGIHFWFDETAGIKIGRAIASNLFANVMTTGTQ
jgi:membrane-associated phospholipid phosphatase